MPRPFLLEASNGLDRDWWNPRSLSGSRVSDPLGDVRSAGGLSRNLFAKDVLAGILNHFIVRNHRRVAVVWLAVAEALHEPSDILV